jgi:cold shock protein
VVGFLTQLANKRISKKMTGTIKTLTDRGFGFIAREGATKDLFFHSKNVELPLTFADLKVGDEVTFEVVEGPKGPAAEHVAHA